MDLWLMAVHRRAMESLAELTFELLSSGVGLAMVVGVVTATVVLSSGLAAFVIELSEGSWRGREMPLRGRILAGRSSLSRRELIADDLSVLPVAAGQGHA